MSIIITHTSPSKIQEISDFGGCAENGTLFFSVNDYAMGKVAVTYDLTVGENDIISASQLFDEAIIAEIAGYFDCDLELAESLLDSSENEWNQDFDCDGEDSWYLQGLRAECAKKMGYLACEDEDENGVVYMIKMDDSILSKMEIRA